MPTSTSQAVPRKPVSLALQGGGSWGAYTWGVLDALLAGRTLEIAQMSGTSAGAINGAIVASALARGSSADARRALRSFWMRVASPDMPAPAALWAAGASLARDHRIVARLDRRAVAVRGQSARDQPAA